MFNVLELIDMGFAAAGCLLIATWGARTITRREPLISQPAGALPFREDAVLLAVFAYVLGAMTASLIMKRLSYSSDIVLNSLVVNNGAQICGIAGCLILAAWKIPGGPQKFLNAQPDVAYRIRRPSLLAGGLIVAIGVCPLIRDFTAWLLIQLVPDYRFETHPTLVALKDHALPAGRIVALWMGAALIAPVAEELFFRGVLQNFLATATGRNRTAILFAAGGFAAVHFTQLHAVPALFFLGLLLGWLYARTGTLAVPVLIHAAFNLKTLVWESLS